MRDPWVVLLVTAALIVGSASSSSTPWIRIGRRSSVGRKPKLEAKATARPLSVPTQ